MMTKLLWQYIGHIGYMDDCRNVTGTTLYGLDKIRRDIHNEIVCEIQRNFALKDLKIPLDEVVRELINPILHNIDASYKDARFMAKKIWKAVGLYQ